jgi:dTDP-4-amino-4,6-dideoxygalactose transaminase
MTKSNGIQMVDLQGQFKYLQQDIFREWTRLCNSSSFILGKEVQNFEEEFAEFLGVPYAVGVCSGTSAIHIALAALEADEKRVITTPFTFIATCEAAVQAGAGLKWVDIDPVSYNISVPEIIKAGLEKSDIILPVHLYGNPADMTGICKLAEDEDLKIVEDCAQAHGAKHRGKGIATFGAASCFSFYPGKNLGAYGDAGCVVTPDKDLAALIKRLRTHGSSDKYYHTELGYNYRLDALQAAVLRIKLKYLDEWNEARIENASAYNKLLEGLPLILPSVNEGDKHVYHQYTVLSESREALKEKLREDGIPTAVHYPVPLHMQPCFSFMERGEGDYPVAEKVAATTLSLPMYPEMKREVIEFIAEKIREFYA